MRARSALAGMALLSLLPACGSAGDGRTAASTKKPGKTPVETGDTAQAGAFDPPPVADGYIRFTAQTIHGVEPGSDVTYCQYVMGPMDHDVDVLDVTGMQSEFGHHAVAFSYTDDGTQEIGTSVPCMGTEFSSGQDSMTGGKASSAGLNMGSFLGGIGGPK